MRAASASEAHNSHSTLLLSCTVHPCTVLLAAPRAQPAHHATTSYNATHLLEPIEHIEHMPPQFPCVLRHRMGALTSPRAATHAVVGSATPRTMARRCAPGAASDSTCAQARAPCPAHHHATPRPHVTQSSTAMPSCAASPHAAAPKVRPCQATGHRSAA